MKDKQKERGKRKVNSSHSKNKLKSEITNCELIGHTSWIMFE